MSTRNILIVGASLKSGNKGVNALTRGTIQGIIDYIKSPEIRILSYSVNEPIKHEFLFENNRKVIIEEIPVSTKNATLLTSINYIGKKIRLGSAFEKVGVFKKIIDIIKWADLVLDISEGDSFSDIYGYKRYIMHSNVKLLALYYGKQLKLLPQTMGPFENKIVKSVTKYICNNATMNYARDMISCDILENEIGVNKDKIRYCSDLAFYMKPEITRKAEGIRNKVDSDILVGINISGLLYNGGYTKNNMFGFIADYKEAMQKIVEMFLTKHSNVQIVFIPHVIVNDFPVEDDLKVCEEMYTKYNGTYSGRVHLWDEHLREDQIKGMLKYCDFFIGGRMHSCIGAISSGVPTAPIAYSRKFIGIWEQFDLADFVADPRNQSLEELINTISIAFENRLLVNEKISSTNIRFRQELKNLFSSL